MPLRGKGKLLRELDERADKLVRGLSLETLKRLAQKTPVDTGRARANWNMDPGGPDTSNIPEGSYGPGEALARETPNALGIRAGDVIYVTNALPYIPALEDGHSGQAPSGMIKLTVAELQPVADEIARDLRGEG